MQNLEVNDTILKIQKTKRELEESIAKDRRNENVDMQDKVNGCTTREDSVKAIQEFKQIIKNKRRGIVWLAYYQFQIFQKFKKKESFVSIVLKLNMSKSTIVFKIVLKN